jgi:hypothetical protein
LGDYTETDNGCATDPRDSNFARHELNIELRQIHTKQNGLTVATGRFLAFRLVGQSPEATCSPSEACW